MEKASEWNGFKRGDAVKVSGLRGSFRFEAYCVNGDADWVDIFGGTFQREKARSVAPDRIKPDKKKRRA